MTAKILILFAAVSLVACNSYKSKMPARGEDQVTPASIDYAFVNAKVFEPHCVRCHSVAGGNKGDVNLESYENVIANLADIEATALVDMTMPPKRAGGPLGAYEQGVLRMWIEAGAPLNAHTPAEPTPTPTPLPAEPSPTPDGKPAVIVEPTWDSIYANILEPKCVRCHREGRKAEEYPLTDRAYVVDEANLLLKAGDPDQSELYTSVIRQDKRMMPPAKTGMVLTEQAKEAIRIWILNGAKD